MFRATNHPGHIRLFSAIFLILSLISAPRPAAADPIPNAGPIRTDPEFRAFWVDGFNDGFTTPAQCDTLLSRVRAAHCNAVFVQVRKRGDAYYASHYEPWATDDTEHFDALDYLCRAAHTPGQPYIQIHAWINACTVGGRHYTQGIVTAHPEWRSLSDTGADFDGETYKIDPGNPAAADWTYRVFMDIVRNYPVDGIHMDFIRYGGESKTAGHWGYNPVSVARFRSQAGAIENTTTPLWNDPLWQQWRRDQVTALVRRIYLGAVALRPSIIVSAATICWGDGPADDTQYEAKSAAYTLVYADWRDWLRQGILDVNCPMTYIDLARHPSYWDHWAAFVKDHQYGHRSVMGIGAWMNTIPDSIHEIEDTRTPSTAGNIAAGAVLFSYAGNDTENETLHQYDNAFYSALAAPEVFGTDVPTPNLPWKDHPTSGYIAGMAIRSDLTPYDGGRVTVVPVGAGDVRTATIDGNGFFGLSDVSPGTYRLETPDIGSYSRIITVRAGDVTRVAPAIPGRVVAGTGDLPDGSTVTYGDVLVTVGSDRLGDNFYIADGFGKPAVRILAPGLSPVTVAGDRAAILGTVRHLPGNPPYIDAQAVRVVGVEMIP
ncbi:MAG: family 10 glycosylhydrolase [Capsulimonadaceae bacterium]